MSASTALSDPCGPRVGVIRVRTLDGGGMWLTAEHTANPHLYITPELSHHGVTGFWRLTHEPTGCAVPRTNGLDVRELRDLAQLIADLDWSPTDPGYFADADRPYVERLREALDRVQGMPGRLT